MVHVSVTVKSSCLHFRWEHVEENLVHWRVYGSEWQEWLSMKFNSTKFVHGRKGDRMAEVPAQLRCCTIWFKLLNRKSIEQSSNWVKVNNGGRLKLTPTIPSIVAEQVKPKQQVFWPRFVHGWPRSMQMSPVPDVESVHTEPSFKTQIPQIRISSPKFFGQTY